MALARGPCGARGSQAEGNASRPPRERVSSIGDIAEQSNHRKTRPFATPSRRHGNGIAKDDILQRLLCQGG